MPVPEQHPVRVIATCNDTSCILRFHCIRPGETFLDDDIEAYKDDGILIIDI
jgi:hypothetical protein